MISGSGRTTASDAVAGPQTLITQPPARTGTGRARGTFGELLQGALPGDLDFLVTLPIRAGSTAVFTPDPLADGVRVDPPHKTKSRTLAELVLRRRGIAGGGLLRLDCALPEGKGLASSSADLVATARAIGDAFGRPPHPSEIESWLRLVEPSDGVMYPGIVAFRHRQVRLHARLGPVPPLTIVAVDEGGEIDTVAFNRIPARIPAADQREYRRLLETLRRAVPAGDVTTIGEVATRSARMNAARHPRPHLDAVIARARSIGAAGVVVAHSGTMIGMLLDDRDPDHALRMADATAWSGSFGTRAHLHRSAPCPPDHPDHPDHPERAARTSDRTGRTGRSLSGAGGSAGWGAQSGGRRMPRW